MSTSQIYSLSLHDALPIFLRSPVVLDGIFNQNLQGKGRDFQIKVLGIDICFQIQGLAHADLKKIVIIGNKIQFRFKGSGGGVELLQHVTVNVRHLLCKLNRAYRVVLNFRDQYTETVEKE